MQPARRGLRLGLGRSGVLLFGDHNVARVQVTVYKVVKQQHFHHRFEANVRQPTLGLLVTPRVLENGARVRKKGLDQHLLVYVLVYRVGELHIRIVFEVLDEPPKVAGFVAQVELLHHSQSKVVDNRHGPKGFELREALEERRDRSQNVQIGPHTLVDMGVEHLDRHRLSPPLDVPLVHLRHAPRPHRRAVFDADLLIPTHAERQCELLLRRGPRVRRRFVLERRQPRAPERWQQVVARRHPLAKFDRGGPRAPDRPLHVRPHHLRFPLLVRAHVLSHREQERQRRAECQETHEACPHAQRLVRPFPCAH
mmetsp:Transcript_2176/g.4775  ORF Transcript_2176/g.4775 Transcript_2176/m.4775 type:complete len:310 (-) Transcript_2176:59-988(-)